MLRYILEHRISVVSVILMLVLLSIVSIFYLPISFFPGFTYPSYEILIKTKPNTVDFINEKVADRFLEGFQSLDGLLYIRKIVSSEYCQFMLHFKWNTDMDVAYLKIKEAINAQEAKDKYLSLMVEDVKIRSTANSQRAFMGILFPESLKNFVKEDLVFKFGSIEGVGRIQIVGANNPEYELVYKKKWAYITDSRVIDRLVHEFNILKNPLSLTLKYGAFKYPFLIKPPLSNFNDILLLPLNKRALKEYFNLRESQPGEEVIYHNKKYIAVFIYPASSGSPIMASKKIRRILENLNVKHKILFDNSLFLKNTIKSLFFVLLYSVFFSILSSYLFLGDLKIGIVIGMSVPLSLLFSFIFIYLAGYSINIVTLGALIMSSGMLIDASVIVMESIMDASSQYKSRKTAVIIGTSSVRSAVVSSMLTNCVVFIPVVFIYGIAGRLFMPFAFVVIVSTLISLFISISLVPMLSYVFNIKPVEKKSVKLSALFFKRMFSLVHKNRPITIIGLVVYIAIGIYSLTQLRFRMFPHTESENVRLKIIDFSNLRTEDIDRTIARILDTYDGVVVKEDNGFKKWTVYVFGIEDYEKFKTTVLKSFPDVVVSISDLKNPLVALKGEKIILNENRTLKTVRVSILPEKVRAYNLDMWKIIGNLRSLLSRTPLGIIDTVKVSIVGVNLRQLDELLSLPVTVKNGMGISLGKIATIDTLEYKPVIGSIWPGSNVPEYERKKTIKTVFHALLFAVLLVFFSIVAVFESVKIAKVAVWQVPLSLFFVSIVFTLFNKDIDIITGIGVIILSGISVNDAIVLLDFINRAIPLTGEITIYKAIEKRTRSILITTVTTVMGLLPLLLSNSAGARLQHGLAIVLILGLLFSTFTSMTIVPEIYTIFKRIYEKHR